jgi:hypothetical protein
MVVLFTNGRSLVAGILILACCKKKKKKFSQLCREQQKFENHLSKWDPSLKTTACRESLELF